MSELSYLFIPFAETLVKHSKVVFAQGTSQFLRKVAKIADISTQEPRSDDGRAGESICCWYTTAQARDGENPKTMLDRASSAVRADRDRDRHVIAKRRTPRLGKSRRSCGPAGDCRRAGRLRRPWEAAAARPVSIVELFQAFGLVTMTFQLPGISLAVSASFSMATDLIGAGATVFGASLVFTAFMLG